MPGLTIGGMAAPNDRGAARLKTDSICRKVGGMDIQAILPLITNAVNLLSNSKKCGDEFDKLLQQVNEETDIAEMKKFLDEKFNVNTVIVDYSCEKTDTKAEMYDTSMLEKYDMHGGRNVIISKKALLRMKKDSVFRQKVYESIKDIPWSSKLTGGMVKGNGVFIHEDGSGVKELNTPAFDELNNMELQADIFISLLDTNKKDKKKF